MKYHKLYENWNKHVKEEISNLSDYVQQQVHDEEDTVSDPDLSPLQENEAAQEAMGSLLSQISQ